MRLLISGFSGWARTRSMHNALLTAVDAAITMIGAFLIVLSVVLLARG